MLAVTGGQPQELVDALADRLQRSVVVEDHTLLLVAFSKHYGDADAARVWALLNRRSRPDDVYYAELRTAHGPVRVLENKELELSARLCVPVRDHDMLLGFLWLIDRDHTLTDAEIADTEDVARRFGKLLHQRLVVRDLDDRNVSYLLDVLLSADRQARSGAAAEMLARGFVENDAYVGVVTVALDGTVDDPSVLPGAIQTCARRLTPGTSVTRSTARAALILLATEKPLGDQLSSLAMDIRAALGTGHDFTVRIGVGGENQNLGDAVTSAAQADIAVRLAGSAACADTIASWSELGPYRLIAQMPTDLVTNSLLPRGLFQLFRSGDANQLITTAETFLDCGGDKQEAARVLGIHRSTMYYRLDRLEAITDLDLSDGGDRLMLHLAVKLRRLGLS